MFPDNTPKEREYFITKAKGAVCIMQIGDKLENGEPHDGRAPDYDDWALNGDILVYYPVLDIALELSSMGIRVDKEALLSAAGKSRLSPSAQNCRSRKQSSMKSCLTPSAAVSVSPVSVCSSCARRTSEKYSAPSGQRKSAKKRKPTESSCCKQ